MASKDDVNNEKDLNKEKREGQRLDNEAKRSSKQIADNVKDTANQYKVVNDEFQSYADAIVAANLEIQGGNTLINKSKKAYNELTSLASKLADNQKELGQLSRKELEDIAKKSAARLQELKSNAVALEEQKRELEEELKLKGKLSKTDQAKLETTKALVAAAKDSFELEENIGKQAEKQLELEEQIADKMGLTGDLIKSSAAVMKKLGVESELVNKSLTSAQAEMRKLAQEGKTSGEVMAAGIIKFGEGLTAAFSDPLAIFGFILKAANKIDKQIVSFQKNLGIASGAATDLRYELAFVANTSSQNFVTTSRLVETFGELTKEIGMSARVFNNDMLEGATLLMGKLHLSAGETANLLTAAQASGMSFDEIQKTIDSTVSTMNQQNKTMFSSSLIAQDVANVSKATLLTNKSNIKALASAASEARRIGMNLSQSEKIAESLLDFESSIGAELEAQLMLGQNINLGKAREAALAGDIETLNKEIGKQQAIFDAFNSKNVLAQEAAAKALGMSRQELAGVVQKQQLASMGAERFEQRFGEVALKQAMAQTAQDKFNDLINKATELVGELAGPVTFILQGVTSLLKALGPVGPALIGILVTAKALGGTFGFISSSISTMGKGIKGFGGMMSKLFSSTPTADKGKDILDKTVSGSGDKTKEIINKTKGADGKKGSSVGSFLKGLGDGLAHIGKKAIEVIKGAGALAISGLALGGSFALALMMVKDVDPVQMLAFAGSLAIFGSTLALIGKMGSSVVKGGLALGFAGIGILAAAEAFSMLEGVDYKSIAAFSIAVPLLALAAAGLGYLIGPIILGSVAIAALGAALIPAAAAFALLGAVDVMGVVASLSEVAKIAPGLALAGIAFAGLGGGLMALGAGALFALPGLAVLAGIASIGSRLEAAGTGVRALAEGIGLLKDNLNELETDKLNELENLISTAAISAPLLALAGGIGNIVAGITGGRGGDNAALEAKLDELIAITAEGKTIVMDGSVVGNTITRVSPKSS